jgi:hypothetical protein
MTGTALPLCRCDFSEVDLPDVEAGNRAGADRYAAAVLIVAEDHGPPARTQGFKNPRYEPGSIQAAEK